MTSLEPLSTKNPGKKLAKAFFIKRACKKMMLLNLCYGSFLRLPERHQATLDELHVLMQRLPRVILVCD